MKDKYKKYKKDTVAVNEIDTKSRWKSKGKKQQLRNERNCSTNLQKSKGKTKTMFVLHFLIYHLVVSALTVMNYL